MQKINWMPRVPGYISKPKGLKQILWERGKYKEGMITQYTNKQIVTIEERGEDVDYSLDMKFALSLCPDFRDEVTILGEVFNKSKYYCNIFYSNFRK